jgi:GH15 family glucan-1,4-alpha-glucosidase
LKLPIRDYQAQALELFFSRKALLCGDDVGLGKTLIGIDNNAELRDLYFPFVGLENHVGGNYRHRVGVHTDKGISWLSDEGWNIEIKAGRETMSGEITAINENIGVELRFEDVLYNEKSIFMRQIKVKNTWDYTREIKVYFGHEFEIYESRRGDTGYYDPIKKTIIHYKGRRAFLINSRSDGRGFDDFNIGLFGIEGKEGSHLDANDGMLSKNPIEHGRVDSIIGIYYTIDPTAEKMIDEPKLGTSLMLDPRFNYAWLTTTITQIIEQTDNTLKFQTENSTYLLEKLHD